ncbi:MAG: methyltransferase [Planctomycetota bacterium]
MAKQWSAEEILKLARGYQGACVLAAAVDLDLFEALGEDKVDVRGIASRIHGDLRGTTILLDALAALDLLAKNEDHYSVPPSLRPLLVPGKSRSVLAMAQHQANCLRRWARLAETVRAGRSPEGTPSVRGEEGDREAFIEAMDVINRDSAEWLIGEIMPVPFTHVLDVGGGSGTWTIAWLSANPGARATLFDLPEVIPAAEQRISGAGLGDRTQIIPGDFYVDPLPKGADLAWVSAIVHQNSRAQNRDLFAKAHAALEPGGRILIRDIVMDESRTSPAGGALFAVNMLVGTSGGGTFTFAELKEDLEASGFETVAQLREDEWMHAVVSARKQERN